LRRRILTTTPSGLKVTPVTAIPSMAMTRSNDVVAHVVPRFGCLNASETASNTCAPFDEVRGHRPVAVDPSGDAP